jgi:uncharacterized protein (DUF433 family)
MEYKFTEPESVGRCAIKFKDFKLTKEKVLAALRCLKDNDVDNPEAVMEAFGAIIFDTDIEDLIDYNEKHYTYKNSIWEEPED